MNKDVFNYLSEKAHDVTDYIKAKSEAVGTYLQDHATDIKDGIVKGTATVLTTAMLLGGMTGCDVLQQGQNPNETTKPPITTPVDKNTPTQSESGLFVGTIYDESDLPPAIEHRTEDEIAETGLSAQDVLNAYDQLAIDIAKALYASNYYRDLSEDAYKKMAVQFESIGTWEYDAPAGNGDWTIKTAPFYATDPYYTAQQTWQSFKMDYSHKFPAVPTTLKFKTFLDGVCFTTTIQNAGIEPNQFAQTMEAFGNKPEVVTDEYLEAHVDKPEDFVKFMDQNAYPALTISRDLINNATPEQLEALYNMLSSLHSIILDQSLPDAANNMDMN